MMKLQRFLSLTLCFLLMCFAFGCSTKQQNDGKIKIVTSFYPMYIFTENLTKGIDDIEVINMTEQVGGCLHDYQLVSDDMVALSDCDLFIVNGAGMESFMNSVTKQLPDLKIITASDGIDLIKDGDETNSHVWMSVPNAMKQVNNIAKALMKQYPDHADTIKSNKKAYLAQLAALDVQIREEMAPFSGLSVITFHEAYNYFAKEYGLKVADCVEEEPGEAPSVKRIAALTQLIKNNNIKALFVEESYGGSSARTLSSETGVRIYKLNPITSGGGALTDYQDIMRQDLNTIKEALS